MARPRESDIADVDYCNCWTILSYVMEIKCKYIYDRSPLSCDRIKSIVVIMKMLFNSPYKRYTSHLKTVIVKSVNLLKCCWCVYLKLNEASVQFFYLIKDLFYHITGHMFIIWTYFLQRTKNSLLYKRIIYAYICDKGLRNCHCNEIKCFL
jgi:hypothetical protein